MDKAIVLMITVIMFALFGCGGASGASKEPTQAKQADEFEEPEIEESNLQGYVKVELTAADETIEIPGTSMGPAPKIQTPGKKSDLNNPSFWPVTEGIVTQMEGLVWGMSVKKVFSIFENKIREKYKEQLQADSGDLLAEDRIRTQMMRELKLMKESYVKFEGQTTGYEAHMIAVEFTHNNGESMMVWDAEKFVEYLFFIEGRFWKRVRLFRKEELGNLDFNSFIASIEGAMGGPGKEFVTAEGNLDRIAWRDADTYADVVDGSAFFGVYGLRFTSAITQTHIAALRKNAGRGSTIGGSSASALLEEVTNSADLDDHKESVIDNYTGTTQSAADGFSKSANPKDKDNTKKKDDGKKDKGNSAPTDEETRSLF